MNALKQILLKKILLSHLCDKNYENIFINLCKYNNIDLLMNIYTKYLSMCNEKILHITCNSGYLKISKKIFENNPNIHFNIHNFFCDACYYGNYKIVKWLTSIKPKIHPYTYNEGFRHACASGNLKLVKWLYNKYTDINISYFNDFAFHMTCANGYIKIAKYLLKNKPDIDLSVNDDFAFRNVCLNNNKQLALWLSKKNPNKYKIINNCNNKINFQIIYEYTVKNNIPKEICCLCFDNETDIMLNCNHKFCKKCIEEWLYNNQKTCPCCRNNNVEIFTI
jgi:ankyrin repeat protein